MKEDEIFITVKNIGFAFRINKRIASNFINPYFLDFFKEDYPPTKEEYLANQKAVEKIIAESEDAFPILPDGLKEYCYYGVIRYLGKRVVICEDKKFRILPVVKFSFNYKDKLFSEIFYVDKRVKQDCAILGRNSCNQLNIE